MKTTQFRSRYLLAGMLAILALSACDKRTAEEKGTALATEKIDMAKGIGNALEKKGGEASEAVTTGLGSVMKGFEKGVNKSGRAINADESLAKAGLKVNRVQDSAPVEGKPHGIDLYIQADADAKGKLRVLMYDVLDQEIGRATVDLKFAADEGRYQRVALDEQLSLSAISKLAVSFKPADLPKK